MKRILSIILLIAVLSPAMVRAQSPESERYSDLIARTEGLPPYEAMYHLLAFQRFHPEHAPVYYRLAEASYTLLPSRDALHNYDERAELLYKARLFYGNCLHFMGGRMPHGETFPTITPAGKKVEFADVDAYLRGRLDTLKRWRAETDTLHDRFYRMVDSYESCRQLFLQFMEKYPSEKLAHLCLTDEDRDNLLQLGRMTRTMEQEKQLFIQALKASPVQHYNPTFRPVEITAYRLDGITSSDFLANDIPLWDYASWTSAFLHVQENTYLPFMRTLVREYTVLNTGFQRFRTGQQVQVEPDLRIPNRVERYDYHSPMSTFIQLLQQAAVTTTQAADSLTTAEKVSDGDLSARITASMMAQERLAETKTLLNTLRQRVDATTERKYVFFLRETGIASTERLIESAEQAVAFQEQLTEQIAAQLRNYAEAYPKQYKDVDISDDKAASDAATQQ